MIEKISIKSAEKRIVKEIEKQSEFLKILALSLWKNKDRFQKETFDFPDYCGLDLDLVERLYSDHVDMIQEHQDEFKNFSPEDFVNLFLELD